ncbi:MAG: hypothetical protein HY721_23465 [Planctomycetes bacterium]|nr:hypothetical protein [Planctomycetota bacterium]
MNPIRASSLPRPGSPAVLVLAVLTCPAPRAALAFNPPSDSAGPLAARIEGPEAVAELERAFGVKVLLENRGGAALEGAVRLGLADRWRAEPAGPVPFRVEAGGTVALDFAVTADAGTPRCHHAIHAFADFEHGGERLSAHPILVLEVQAPEPPPRAEPLPWEPAQLPAGGGLALWRLPLFRAVLQVRGEAPRVLAAGWTGSDERTRCDVRRGRFAARGVPREGLSIHPPWSGGLAGTALVELPVALPASRPARLRFATAIREHDAERGEPPSDGVTFRVRAAPLDAPDGALGDVVFERHSSAKAWEEGDADLGRFAGRAVRLQLESDPGPKLDTTCDQSFWAEPILIAGSPPPEPPFPPDPAAPSRSPASASRRASGRAAAASSTRRSASRGARPASSSGASRRASWATRSRTRSRRPRSSRRSRSPPGAACASATASAAPRSRSTSSSSCGPSREPSGRACGSRPGPRRGRGAPSTSRTAPPGPGARRRRASTRDRGTSSRSPRPSSSASTGTASRRPSSASTSRGASRSSRRSTCRRTASRWTRPGASTACTRPTPRP